MRRRIVATTLAMGIVAAACGGGGETAGSPSPQPTPARPVGSPSPTTPSAIGTADVARWGAALKDAMEPFLRDLRAVFDAIRARDLKALREALGRLPGDAHEAVRRIDAAGAAPPGLADEVAHLRSLLDRTAALVPRLRADCLHSPGLPCAADVAQLASITAQLLDVLKPLGIDVNIRIEL